MTSDPEGLTLRMLRGIDAKIDRLDRRMDGMTVRLQAVEGGLVSVRKEIVHLHEAMTAVNTRLDNMDRRVNRAERRMEIIEGPEPPAA